MLLLIPFLISLILVLVSSYLLASVFEPKKYGVGFLYTLLIAFAQIVVTFEFLSLLNSISVSSVVLCNIVIFFTILTFWDKKGKPLYKPQIKETFSRIFKALKSDKILMIMAVGFIFLIGLILFMDIIMPVNGFDALTYHLNRAAFWVSQGSLNHFEIADDRNLVMPINSEILYTWVLLFLKNDWCLGLFSFFGYLAGLVSLYNILGFFKFDERRKLWSVFLLSSFASLIAEASGIETDVIIGGLIMSSILLYVASLKERKISLIFFSALAYALAIGTKTPSLIAFPAVFMLLAYFSILRMKKEGYKPLLAFLFFLFINFMIFGSFNYILNWMDYGHPIANESSRIIHKFWGGPKAFIGNYIRYIFMLFDFSGFRYSEYVGKYILEAKFMIFDLLRIPHELGVTMSDNNEINNGLMDVKMGAGILGFLVFLPCALFSVIAGVITLLKCKSKKVKTKLLYILPFGALFFINLLFLSGALGFMVFSVRFVSFFIMLSSPVLVFSYFKKKPIIKLLILFFVLSYMLLISTHLAARSVKGMVRILKTEPNITQARETMRCSLYRGYVGEMSFCRLRTKMRTYPKGSKIGVIAGYSARLYPIKMLSNEGYQIDILLSEVIEKYDLSQYDYLIRTETVQTSSNVLEGERALSDYTLDGRKFKFFTNHPSKCIYLGPTNRPVTKDNVQPITYSLCRIEESYLKKLGFKLVEIIDYQSVVKDNANLMYFYENIK